jgi:CDGSH-type Zn-finger protein
VSLHEADHDFPATSELHGCTPFRRTLILDASTERSLVADVTIRPTENGPYLIEGAVRVIDADGREYELRGRRIIALCRCGGSTTKPFCDGTHSRIGFDAAERAVAELEMGSSEGA